MRLRRVALLLVGGVLLAEGCSRGPVPLPGVASVIVVDSRGKPLVGADVVSTQGGRILGQAVTDSQGRVIGVAGLRICDALVMPTVPCANLNVPVMMIAEKIAGATEK